MNITASALPSRRQRAISSSRRSPNSAPVRQAGQGIVVRALEQLVVTPGGSDGHRQPIREIADRPDGARRESLVAGHDDQQPAALALPQSSGLHPQWPRVSLGRRSQPPGCGSASDRSGRARATNRSGQLSAETTQWVPSGAAASPFGARFETQEATGIGRRLDRAGPPQVHPRQQVPRGAASIPRSDRDPLRSRIRRSISACALESWNCRPSVLAMALNASPSSPNSSCDATSTRALKSLAARRLVPGSGCPAGPSIARTWRIDKPCDQKQGQHDHGKEHPP